jgi:hypothetical protein
MINEFVRIRNDRCSLFMIVATDRCVGHEENSLAVNMHRLFTAYVRKDACLETSLHAEHLITNFVRTTLYLTNPLAIS